MIVKRCSITTLCVDIIVNAANPEGLGCFTPGHNCIDNVIHREAGPLLYEECKIHMSTLKVLGSVPFLTLSYNLPCKYILHVTGPMVVGPLTENMKQHLSDCYTNCLLAAEKVNARHIAFPCVSTGIYRFNNKIACDIAYATVKKFLESRKSDIIVVFCVYNDKDEALYTEKVYSNMYDCV